MLPTWKNALVWQPANVPQANIDVLTNDIGHGLDSLRQTAAGMVAARPDGDADLPRLKQIASQSAAYAKLLGDALDQLCGVVAVAG